MKSAWNSIWAWLLKILRKYFLAGILVIVPLYITVTILVWIFNYVDDILQPIINTIAGRHLPGVGFAITLIIIYIAGAVASSVGGKAAIRFGESIVARVPIVRMVYSGLKQIVESFSTSDRKNFMQVVLIEFPRKGMRTIGFITNESSDKTGKKLLNVFVPTTPNPTSGFLQIVEESEVIRTNMKVDDAIMVIVSAGRMSHKEIHKRLSEET